MRLIRKLDRFLAKTETWFLILILTGMVFLSFGQVLLRNLFESGPLWADTLLRQMVMWVGFLGASLAVHDGKHLSIDFLSNLVPGQAKFWLGVGAKVSASIISFYLACASWDFLVLEKEAESILFSDLPVWWFQLILPYSFGIISFRFLLEVFSKEESGKESTS